MSYVHPFTELTPPARFDDVPWNRVRSYFSATVDGTFTVVETDTLGTLDADPSSPQPRDVTVNTAPAASGWFKFTFLDSQDNESPSSDPVFSPADGVSFATLADIEARLGRDLTVAEAAQVNALLALVTALIADAVGRDDDWASTLSPVPALVKVVAIEAVTRILQNPSGATSVQEALGEYSHAERYESGGNGYGLYLSSSEERMLRRLYATSGSVRVGSLVNDIGIGPADTV